MIDHPRTALEEIKQLYIHHHDLSLNFRAYLLACAYVILLLLMPLPFYPDYNNYTNYVSNSYDIFCNQLNAGILFLLSNEPVWLLLNTLLSLMIVDLDLGVRIISSLSAFLSAFALLRISQLPNYRLSLFLIILLLLHPSVCKNYLIHLRQGCAISFFLLGWYLIESKCHKKIGCAFVLLTPFIHSSFFFVVMTLGFVYFHRFVMITPYISLVLFGLLVFFLSISLPPMIFFLGARQGLEYALQDTYGTGAGFLLYLFLFLLMLLAGAPWLHRHLFAATNVLLYLTLYWQLVISMRVFESALPLFFMSIFLLPLALRIIAVTIIFLFVVWSLVALRHPMIMPFFS